MTPSGSSESTGGSGSSSRAPASSIPSASRTARLVSLRSSARIVTSDPSDRGGSGSKAGSQPSLETGGRYGGRNASGRTSPNRRVCGLSSTDRLRPVRRRDSRPWRSCVGSTAASASEQPDHALPPVCPGESDRAAWAAHRGRRSHPRLDPPARGSRRRCPVDRPRRSSVAALGRHRERGARHRTGPGSRQGARWRPLALRSGRRDRRPSSGSETIARRGSNRPAARRSTPGPRSTTTSTTTRGFAIDAGQPPENAFTHIGFYLAWLIRHDLHDRRWFPREHVAAVLSGEMTGSDLADDTDGKLMSEHMTDEGSAFSDARYRAYLHEYERLVADEPDYSVVDDAANYTRIAAAIDALYAAWVAGGRPASEPEEESMWELPGDGASAATRIPWEEIAKDADGPFGIEIKADGSYVVVRPPETATRRPGTRVARYRPISSTRRSRSCRRRRHRTRDRRS